MDKPICPVIPNCDNLKQLFQSICYGFIIDLL